jgi:ectoine hydroxylase-related dioxygenase (phytanoyl-CoA dioxygenase family)
MPEGLDAKVAFFREQGFVILRGVLSRDDLDELGREIHRVARDHGKLKAVREGFSLEKNQDSSRDTPTFRKIGGINEHSDAFARLVLRNEKMLDVLHAIMGPTIELWRDIVMMKAARVGREKPWHQDSCYWPWRPMNLVSAMTALDDATPENGCLQVIPGTHTQDLPHLMPEPHVDVRQMQDRTVFVPLEAGDTLLFHSLMLHASQPNRSDRDRRVIINSYKTPDLQFTGPGKQRPCPLVSKR